MHLVSVGLSAAEVPDYYEVFCNATLWPLYHEVIVAPEFSESQADACSCSMASSMATASPRASATAVAADTVLGVPTIGATAIRAPCTSSSVRPESAAADRFNRYEAVEASLKLPMQQGGPT